MKKVKRERLPKATEEALKKLQSEADGIPNGDQAIRSKAFRAFWKSARQKKPVLRAFRILKEMAGNRERCMYCVDSHGSDIDHFWPQTRYPERMFAWLNWLLCCCECGRIKLDKFPLEAGVPLLVDPTAIDPWLHLDFDPDTGNMVARYNLDEGDWDKKGLSTVEVLQLDRREGLAAAYQQTNERLQNRLNAALNSLSIDPHELSFDLLALDDHGLLGWYFFGTGQSVEPFKQLREMKPEIWEYCVHQLIKEFTADRPSRKPE